MTDNAKPLTGMWRLSSGRREHPAAGSRSNWDAPERPCTVRGGAFAVDLRVRKVPKRLRKPPKWSKPTAAWLSQSS
jgi:hypothetical protein